MKPKERELLQACLSAASGNDFQVVDLRTIADEKSVSWNQAAYYAEKWEDRGWVGCGVSIMSFWFEDYKAAKAATLHGPSG